jgi:ABC-2 type transport system permease protein
MNFVIFPMFFMSSALYPLWKLRESGAEILYLIASLNPFTHVVELVRFAAYGQRNDTSLMVVIVCTIVAFLVAVLGYDPQRGFIRRAKPAG